MDRITVYAPGNLDPFDSYGLIACELLRHLNRMGVYANAVALGKQHTSGQDKEVAQYASQVHSITMGGILLGYPTNFHLFGGLANQRPKIAVTMFESSKLPANWLEPLSTCDAVIVPGNFCYQVFLDSGVPDSKLFALPLGINPIYGPVIRASNRPWTYLAFMDRGRRKGGIYAIEAFLRAHGSDPDYRLILKARKGRVEVEFDNDNITILQEDMSPEQLYDLYANCDVLLNPNMGEGFGLIPREAAATGMIVLATGWGGTADDITKWGWPIPYTLIPADWKGIQRFEQQDLGNWALPDVFKLAEYMRTVAEHRNVYQWRALERADSLHKLYSWHNFAAGVYAIWRDYAYERTVAA